MSEMPPFRADHVGSLLRPEPCARRARSAWLVRWMTTSSLRWRTPRCATSSGDRKNPVFDWRPTATFAW